MTLTASEVILSNLIHNREYSSRVLPFLKKEYFKTKEEQLLFGIIENYTSKYASPPTVAAIYITLDSSDFKIKEGENSAIRTLVEAVSNKGPDQDIDWLIDTTESFCKEMAIHNAIVESITIFDDKEKVTARGSIPDILKEALAVTFDTKLGHDFLLNAEERHDYYHLKEVKVPFDLDILNRFTKGGFSRKTLNLFIASAHAGKSALMCHMAAANLKDGKNVIYFTLEMSEEEISKRIDANVMGITIDQLLEIGKDNYLSRIDKIKQSTGGRLIVKEYPMASASVAHFRTFINELRLKQNFVPDIIYIDYLNICLSVRMKHGGNTTSYTYMKAVSEEFRGFASEINVPIVSATQFNRQGSDNSDPDMTDISESYAVGFGVDFMCAVIVSDELKSRNHILLKQLKNRYDDMGKIPKAFLGFDRGKMTFYDIETPNDGIVPEAALIDKVKDKTFSGFDMTP